jgi:tetratricopeptide (TPR) repeat protein
MNDDLLARVAAAKTGDERSWIVTQSLLEILSPELQSMVWAAAIPHWFNADVLAALRPELREQAPQLYQELQELPFVEAFTERGHNVHELTRRLMLEHLWQENPTEFRALSANAAQHFAQTATSESHIEAIYHAIIADPDSGADALELLIVQWNNSFRFAELEALADVTHEQVEARRTDGAAAALIHLNSGEAAGRVYRHEEALQQYEEALKLFSAVGDRLGEANTVRSIGNVLQFLKRNEEALQQYEEALKLFRAVGDQLGEANTLRSIGDVLQYQDQYEEALQRYEEALKLFRAVGSQQGEANTLKSIGNVLQYQDQYEEALQRYEEALKLFRAVGDRLGEGNTVRSIGDVLQYQDQYEEALQQYEEALKLFRAVGDRLGEANTLMSISDVLQFLKQNEEALQQYEEALKLFRAVGSRLGEANTLYSYGNERLAQQDFGKALEFFLQAQVLYENINDQYSQSRNLFSLAVTYLQIEQNDDAMEALVRSARLADAIRVDSLRQRALEVLVSLSEAIGDWTKLHHLLDELMAAHPDDELLQQLRTAVSEAEVRSGHDKPGV